jgi:hypothetical protein
MKPDLDAIGYWMCERNFRRTYGLEHNSSTTMVDIGSSTPSVHGLPSLPSGWAKYGGSPWYPCSRISHDNALRNTELELVDVKKRAVADNS